MIERLYDKVFQSDWLPWVVIILASLGYFIILVRNVAPGYVNGYGPI